MRDFLDSKNLNQGKCALVVLGILNYDVVDVEC